MYKAIQAVVDEFVPKRDVCVKEEAECVAQLVAVKEAVPEKKEIFVPQYVFNEIKL